MPLSGSRRTERRLAVTREGPTIHSGPFETIGVTKWGDLRVREHNRADDSATAMAGVEEPSDASSATAVVVTAVHIVVSARVEAVDDSVNRGLDELANPRRRGQEDQRHAPAQE